MAEQALNNLNEKTRHAIDTFLSGAGDLPDWDVAFIQLTYHLEPEDLTLEVLTGCCPYTRPDSFREKMTEAVQRGWLQETNGGFRLTPRGREVAAGIRELGDRLFAKIEVLPLPQMERLLTLLEKVVAKIKILPQPEKKRAFELSLHFEREPTAPSLARIRRRIIDVLAFRDDAHSAARNPHEPDGLLWETFTYVWRGIADNAPDLADQLSYREYIKRDYVEALKELAARGWLQQLDDRYIIRQSADRMQQQVEEATDNIFDTAFGDLTAVELAELKQLMQDFAHKPEAG